MSTISNIIADVRMYCGEPTNEILGLGTILRVLQQQQTILNNDLALSQQNQLLRKQFIGIPAQDFPISAMDFNALAGVEVRLDEASNRWMDVSIVDRTSINSETEKGNRAAAIYGTPSRIALSWIPSNEPSLPIQIWYETTPAIQSITDTPHVKASFHPLLTMRAAKMCREVILDMPPNAALDRNLAVIEEQWKEDINKSSEQKPFMRETAYNVGRRWQ